MIDLHCHILPGLDDGALDLEDSVAMARQAQQDGIAALCATPHIRADHAVRIEQIATRVHALQEGLAAAGVDVHLLPGGELAQPHADHLSDAELRLITLGGAGVWLLLEPAAGPLDGRLQELVERLRTRGFQAVIAHPERHAGADFIERLRRLVRAGCLIQWTAEFVAQTRPGEVILELAREDLVHLLGSDAHSSHGGRAVRLQAGFSRLASVLTPTQMAWTRDQAPRAIVRGEPLMPRP